MQKKPLKKSWKGGNKTDKYEKCAESLMKLGDSIIARRKRKVRIIKKIAFSLSGLCAAVLLSVSLYSVPVQIPHETEHFEPDIIQPATTDIPENSPQETTQLPPVTLPPSTTSEGRISAQAETTACNADSDTVQTAADTIYITEYTIIEETVFSEAEQPDNPVQTEPPTIEEPAETVPVTPEIPVTPDTPDYSGHYLSFKADNSGIRYTRVSGTVAESAIYELIGTQKLAEKTKNGEISCNAELFSLKNISPSALLSVRYEEAADFVLYRNQDYKPDTLGDFIDDTGINIYAAFDSAEYSDFTDGYQLLTYQGFESEKIIDFLLESSDAECYSYSDLPPEQIIPEINIICDMNSVIPLKSGFGVSEKGYLTTNLTGGGIVFDIGKEKAVNIINYITANYSYETFYSENENIDFVPDME